MMRYRFHGTWREPTSGYKADGQLTSLTFAPTPTAAKATTTSSTPTAPARATTPMTPIR